MIGTTDGGRSHLIQQPSIILTFEFRGMGQLYATGPLQRRVRPHTKSLRSNGMRYRL